MYAVNILSGGFVIDTRTFFEESAAEEFASEMQDQGYKVRVVDMNDDWDTED